MSMKGIMIFLVLGAWIVGIYYGYVYLVRKAMKTEPKSDSEVMARSLQQEEQRRKARETLEQQRRLMQDRQRTIQMHRNR
ncbi:MAG: hypothetical protein Q8Q08_07945 [Candidatus Omnitrophota bacterium]|nr:hypothetical protein [Candidatus Omnitrophota bacterium]MDZ4243099.1 hypothetical protein [Candidatus Omnitrophota bacterium]